MVDDEEEYEVEDILDSRFYRRQFQYLVKWKGYGDGDNTWEPADNCAHAPEIIENFHRRHPNAPRKLNSVLAASLATHLRPMHTQPNHEDLAAQYPATHDLAWTDGVRLGNPPRTLLARDSTLQVQLVGGKAPTRGSDAAAGLDLYANGTLTIDPRQRALVPTGIKVKLPVGTYGRIAPRSGLSLKGIDVAAGVVDRDYTGELKVVLINNGLSTFTVNHGDCVAQLVLERIANADIELVTNIGDTARGTHGFGSTGK